MTANMPPHAPAEQNSASRLTTNFSGEERVKLLDAIDELRNLDIENDIPLPQIIVVGDQNAGKSSVLEAISGVPFPTNNVACTRFAIEVVLRRSPKVHASARLVTKGDQRSGDCFDTTNFRQRVQDLGPLSTDHISDVIDIAAEALGVADGSSFSDNVLRIEVSGPDQEHLSLIDLPGFFSYTKKAQDPEARMLVQNLAERYMRNDKSIILAVITGGTDYQNQRTLEIVKAEDPLGKRTLGVLTAVDKLDRGSDLQKQFLDLALNRIHQLTLGWHTLRNPSYTDRTEGRFDRSKIEDELFRTSPWNLIPEPDRGAQELRAKLSRTLMDHVERKVGDVVKAINQKITENEAQLKELGPYRATPEQRKDYLSDIATEHERLVRAGLEGSYEHPFFETKRQCIRARVRAAFESFEQDLRVSGHKWDFWTETYSSSSAIAPDIGRYAILGGPAPGDKPLLITREQYLQKVNTVLMAQRGLELPDGYNPKLAGTLFRDQSSKWRGYAEALISRIVAMVATFLRDSIAHVTDARRADLIYQQKLHPALVAREIAMGERLTELMRPLIRAPMTYNLAYSTRLAELSAASSAKQSAPNGTINRPACERLVAQLEAYYDIARATYVDNVINLGIEHCLLDGLDTIFCPSAFNKISASSKISDEEIDLLASEFPEDAQRRDTLTRNLDKLKAGREVCRKHDYPADESPSQPASPVQRDRYGADFVHQPEPHEKQSPFVMNLQEPSVTPQSRDNGDFQICCPEIRKQDALARIPEVFSQQVFKKGTSRTVFGRRPKGRPSREQRTTIQSSCES